MTIESSTGLIFLFLFVHLLSVLYAFSRREKLYSRIEQLSQLMINNNTEILRMTSSIKDIETESCKNALEARRYNDYCKELAVIVENCRTTINAQNATIEKLSHDLRSDSNSLDKKDFN